MLQTLTQDEFVTMRKAGKVASSIIKKLKRFIKPGISTKDIEKFFDKYLEKYPEMEAAFKGFNDYPASICVSVNEEVIHGIPSPQKILEDGDIVSVDMGIKYKGLFIDTAHTYIVGRASKLSKKLQKATLRSLKEGIKKARAGAKVGDIGSAIQQLIEKKGFSVIRKFVGHGIGRELHMYPEIPNFGEKGTGEEIKEGYAIAIEPMVSAGTFDVEVMGDGWTAKTKDNSLSAHFEHTIAITKKGPWILTQ